MINLKKLSFVILLTPLFVACSKGPSEAEVEDLIESQYAQAETVMDEMTTGAGDSEMAGAMGNMLSAMMPKLEDVSNVSCDEAEGDNAYRCTADITYELGGTSSTEQAVFKVYDVNGKWVIDN